MTDEELEAIAEKSANISFLAWDLNADESFASIDGREWQKHPERLHTKFVFVGLNPSAKVDKLTNLHSGQGDCRLRHAVFGTRFWGSIFMDIEPDVIESKSENVQGMTADRYKAFKDLLKSILQTIPPANGEPIQLVAVGNKAFDRLKKFKRKLSEDLGREIIIHKVWHYSTRNDINGITDEDYDKMFRDFSDWLMKNPGEPFSPKRKKNSSSKSKPKNDNTNLQNQKERQMAPTPQNDNRQFWIDYAVDYYLKKKDEWDLGYQPRYNQFYKKGHEQECKIRLGNNGHFIDFYMQSSDDATIQNWENFLRHVEEEDTGKWEIVSGRNRSQLILKDNYQPTKKAEVENICDIFYGLFQRYENFHN